MKLCSVGEKGVDLSRGIIQNLNVQEALGDIHSTIHFVDEIRRAADLLIQLSDKLCKIFGKLQINNQTLNALSKNSIITLIISVFLLYPRVPEQFKCFIFNKLWK